MHGEDYRGEYVGEWFISQAYSMILLRDEGYPMVSDVDMLNHGDMTKRYLLARTHCTYGEMTALTTTTLLVGRSRVGTDLTTAWPW